MDLQAQFQAGPACATHWRRDEESAGRRRLRCRLSCGRPSQMHTSAEEQVCGHWPRNLALPWRLFKDAFALVERAMLKNHAGRAQYELEPAAVDFVRFYSVLIRKPLSCVMRHDIARYSGRCSRFLLRS